MIILDTNVISELMKETPNPLVIQWIKTQEKSNIAITTITIAEITYGLQALPSGLRQRTLENAFQKTIELLFSERMLGFDQKAAEIYGHLMAHRKKMGSPMGICDGQIAAIALAHQTDLATRNVRDFIECHLEMINPFSDCSKNSE